MFNKEYWNIKAQTNGHTGHAEPFYYCFDQQARLFAIDEIIKKSSSEKGSVLDFGCGSGDFIGILNKYYKTIYAFDISEEVVKLAKKRFNESNVIISDNYNQIISYKPVDLILTVTVLQSIKKQELDATIQT
jgi:2-polyprenyl-3-methyl-5-hydroxy-6-metoxy-1,4-benzoquinol methylase